MHSQYLSFIVSSSPSRWSLLRIVSALSSGPQLFLCPSASLPPNPLRPLSIRPSFTASPARPKSIARLCRASSGMARPAWQILFMNIYKQGISDSCCALPVEKMMCQGDPYASVWKCRHRRQASISRHEMNGRLQHVIEQIQRATNNVKSFKKNRTKCFPIATYTCPSVNDDFAERGSA